MAAGPSKSTAIDEAAITIEQRIQPDVRLSGQVSGQHSRKNLELARTLATARPRRRV